MEIQVKRLNQSQSSLSLDSEIVEDRCINLEIKESSPVKKECFKVIYGVGKSADRKRQLESETKAERKRREQLEKEDE